MVTAPDVSLLTKSVYNFGGSLVATNGVNTQRMILQTSLLNYGEFPILIASNPMSKHFTKDGNKLKVTYNEENKINLKGMYTGQDVDYLLKINDEFPQYNVTG